MKIAIITDTHCGAGNDNHNLNQFFISFYQNLFFPYLKQHEIKHVVHLGDTFDRRKYINFNTLNSWQKMVFEPLNRICDRVDILVGNHDTYYKNTNEINSVEELLKIYDKFHIYNKATEAKLGDKPVLYVPWICEDNVQHTLNMINTTTANLCMGHLEIIGFEMYAGHINSDKGYKSELYDKFYMTLSGHFHQKSSHGNIHYLGAPYPMMWGDYGSMKGFHVLDTDTLELSFIENENQMFQKIYYDDSDKELANKLLNDNYSTIASKFIKVIVTKKTDPYMFDAFLEKLQKNNPADLSVIESSFSENELNAVEIDNAKDTLTILKECANSLTTHHDKTSLNNLLRELYLEALNTNEHIQGNG